MDRETLLNNWYEAHKKAEAAKTIIAAEQALRKKVAAAFFDGAREGTHYSDLGNGYRLRLTAKANRRIDESTLQATQERLRGLGVNADALVRYKPEIVAKEYKALTKEQRLVFDETIIENDPSVRLDVVPPKVEP